MIEVSIVVRGGMPSQLKNEITDIIEGLKFQDIVFITDTNKSHAIDLVVTDINSVRPVIQRLQGAYRLSLINGDYVGSNNTKYIAVLGKMGDGVIQQAVQAQLKGLF